MAKAKRRNKPKDNGRRVKKKVSILTSEQIDYVDWKDVNLLRRFLSERSKIRARRVTGNSTQQQKMVADAIKIAREMALVPYTNRVTTQRSGRGDRDRDRSVRADTPMPRPSSPPPGASEDHGIDADEAVGVTELARAVEVIDIDEVTEQITDATTEATDEATTEATGEATGESITEKTSEESSS